MCVLWVFLYIVIGEYGVGGIASLKNCFLNTDKIVLYLAILESFHVSTYRFTSFFGKSMKYSTGWVHLNLFTVSFVCLACSHFSPYNLSTFVLVFSFSSSYPNTVCLQYQADLVFEKKIVILIFCLEIFQTYRKAQKQYNEPHLEILIVNILSHLLSLPIFKYIYKKHFFLTYLKVAKSMSFFPWIL